MSHHGPKATRNSLSFCDSLSWQKICGVKTRFLSIRSFGTLSTLESTFVVIYPVITYITSHKQFFLCHFVRTTEVSFSNNNNGKVYDKSFLIVLLLCCTLRFVYSLILENLTVRGEYYVALCAAGELEFYVRGSHVHLSFWAHLPLRGGFIMPLRA